MNFEFFTDWLLRQGVAYSFVKCFFLFFSFFSFFFAEKVCYLGSKYLFPDSSQKAKGTPWPPFFDILASFGVINVCPLFREIE